MTYLLMALSWSLFYFLHTALAASKLKRFLKARWPRSYKWYRLFYSILSMVLFLVILVQALFLPVQVLYSPGKFGQYAGYLITSSGVMIFLKSLKEVSIPSFLGLSTVSRSDSNSKLVVTGMYSQIRHPLYLGILVIFAGYFLVSGTLGALIHLGCLVLYLPFGIYFEEKNLISIFGKSYQDYQQEVPVFIPRAIKKGT